jgi:MYXO-CTERM domain-containing protein
VSDPLIESDQAGLVTPIWDDASASFASGETTIRGEFLRLVEAYGALGQGSPAADAASASDMPTDDIRGYPRDATPDLGAYELGAVPGQGGAGAGGGGGGAGGGASSAGAGGSAQAGDSPTSEEGGCGCRTTPGPAGTSAWLLALVSLIAAGRVTRSRRTRT